MDFRGIPLAVLEAAAAALRESVETRKFVDAYPNSDAELLTDLAPALAAGFEAFQAHLALKAECDAAGGHTIEFLTDPATPANPIGMVCAHCSYTWAVVPAPAIPDVPRPTADADAEPAAAPAPPAPAPTRKRRAVASLRAEPEPPPEPDAPVHPCEACGNPIDTADLSLEKANSTCGPSDLCRDCFLTCAVNPDHHLGDLDEGVLAYYLHRVRACHECAKTLKGAPVA